MPYEKEFACDVWTRESSKAFKARERLIIAMRGDGASIKEISRTFNLVQCRIRRMIVDWSRRHYDLHERYDRIRRWENAKK